MEVFSELGSRKCKTYELELDLMKFSHAACLSLIFCFLNSIDLGFADSEEKKTKVTGEIRAPREGEEIEGHYFFKGRTRGAPDGHVAMVFLSNAQHELFYPYGEPGDANRSFSCEIYHSDTHFGAWVVHLYVLPENDAEKLAAWFAEVSHLAAQGVKIQPYDPALMQNATEVAFQRYKVKRD